MDDKFMDIPDDDKLNTLSLLKIKIISGKGRTLVWNLIITITVR